MVKILLVKTSSLGDVVHNFPVATDVRSRFPEARIDWAVEEAYVPLVALHPAVASVIPVAIRRWSRRPLGRATWAEIGALRGLFGTRQYDVVIDTQGLVKSALVARAARGRRHGFDAGSAREPLAARFYDVAHHVARAQPAIVRNRALAASALGYRIETPADFGLRPADAAAGTWAGAGARRTAVLLHASSGANKLWPEARWVRLARELEARGFQCVLPWGNELERRRGEAIAAALARPLVPALLPLAQVAASLARASAVVGLDTGLTHLAAALGVPVVALFCGSDPALTGVYGAARARNLGGAGELPEVEAVLQALAQLAAIQPEREASA